MAKGVCHSPKLYFYPQLVIFVIGVIFTITNLKFDMSRNNLVGSDKKYHQNFLKFQKEFPVQDDLVVVIESDSLEKNRQFVERIGARLEQETNIFTDVFYKGDLKLMGPKALMFVPDDQLGELEQTLKTFRPFIGQFTRSTNLVSLFNLINTQFRTAKREESADNESLIKAIPALERIIAQARESLTRSGTPPSPGLTALFGAGEEAEREMYITFAKGKIYLVTARAKSEEKNGDAVVRMRELVAEIQHEVPGVNVGITGEPILEVDEMEQSQFDSTVASIISLVLSALIFIYGYRQTGRPLKATFCLIIGLGYTLAFTTLVIGHLNILTITFVPILIGLAIDFGVHLITRYEEELRHGKTPEAAIEIAMVNTGFGIFTGALTTAGAFLAMAGTGFKGIQEMGIICGGGMLLCLVPMMTMLPVLLLRGRQNVIDGASHETIDRRAKIENYWLQRPITVSIVAVVLCLLAASQFHKVYFDYNLLNMQSHGLPAVEYEHKLIESAEKSVLFAAVVATNLDQAHDLEERIKQLPSVASVESMSRYMVKSPQAKLEMVGKIKEGIADIQFATPDTKPVNVSELSSSLFSLSGYLGLALEEVAKENRPDLIKQLTSLRNTINSFRKDMFVNPEKSSATLSKFQSALFNDIRDTFAALQHQDNRAGLRAEDLPPALHHRFIGVSGHHLLQVFPKKDIWNREYQEEFIKELRTIDPNVTGTPVQLLEYTTLLKNSYQEAAWYSLIAITIFVFIHFRSPVCVVLSLLPVAVGSLWVLGLMGAFGIPFNPANIMTLPLVVGIGVTNGIHILNRFAEEQNPGILAKSTGKAVLVSGLTTIAGFGSLIFAKHQGIESLGLLMSLGVTACMIAGLTFLPAWLNLLIRWGWRIKKTGDDMHMPPPISEEPR